MKPIFPLVTQKSDNFLLKKNEWYARQYHELAFKFRSLSKPTLAQVVLQEIGFPVARNLLKAFQ